MVMDSRAVNHYLKYGYYIGYILILEVAYFEMDPTKGDNE